MVAEGVPRDSPGQGPNGAVKGKPQSDAVHAGHPFPIIDIRSEKDGHSIVDAIHEGLNPGGGVQKSLPTLLLYDKKGLKLFEDITYLDEYYLTNAEIEVLKTCADSIAERIAHDSIVVELGSGNLRKTGLLLDALDRRLKAGQSVDYFALDLDLSELQRTLTAVPKYEHINCFGLHGTYDDGLRWLRRPENSSRPKTVLWLGSSIGNFGRKDAASFLRAWADMLQQDDKLLIGVDNCKTPERVYRAYNDSRGVTHSFILNGLTHANRLLGTKTFEVADWTVVGNFDSSAGRHHAALVPSKDCQVLGVKIKKGEHVHVEESFKYSPEELEDLWTFAGLASSVAWKNGTLDYTMVMVGKPHLSLAPQPESYAADPVPSLKEWHELWAVWDKISLGMLPTEELESKPIKLRNACIFYLGHIPAFLDIHLTRATGEPPTHPAYFHNMFERGIDPDVDNPENCHAHSEIPDSWPPLEDLVRYQERVRERVAGLYASGSARDMKIGRSLWLAFEHECMHLETYLYMLLQSDKTLQPPGTIKPDFAALARQANAEARTNEWFQVPASDFRIGLHDPEENVGPRRFHGWDIERPPRNVQVRAFEAKGRPITNQDYALYLERTGKSKLPASWTENPRNGASNGHVNGNDHREHGSVSPHFLQGKAVRTMYGPVPLDQALHWPVAASYDELAGCAKYMGGRIPTLEEARSIYNFVDQARAKDVVKARGETIPAVNSHLVNDGVEESPPSKAKVNGSRNGVTEPKPNDLFVDLRGCNVGLTRWHPSAVAQNGHRLSGQGDFGGIWEWTSTPLREHEGYKPMDLYPAYSSDFFDEKHNIVLGGSWATHPRLAGRKTFVNWYQRNYPYVWAGARLVRDV